ncbi:hypothetical protein CC78DRAFT_107085 [Lojkania enalia]|uniref:Uncharacterized protein n=1 Tax=Lojkania enalia TaxID=147567 RepID=A0A9P4N5Z5_9PLEO|nr:hypothetical protein CC78DRAFT_107085 [Didymosphaeria enalia]
MERKVKSLLRRATPRKEELQPPSHTDETPQQISGLTRNGTNSVQSESKITIPEWVDRSSEPFNHELQPVSLENSQREATQNAVAEDYRAYIPALSSYTPNDLPEELKYMTLGGDTRLMTEASTLKYQEDVADRNIDKLSPRTVPSQLSPLETTERSDSYVLSRQKSDSISGLSRQDRTGSLPISQPATPQHYFSQQDQPIRIARDEFNLDRRYYPDSFSADDIGSQSRHIGLRHTPHMPDDEHNSLRTAFMDSSGDDDKPQEIHGKGSPLDGIVDMDEIVDFDHSTRVAPGKLLSISYHIAHELMRSSIAVTHEVVKSHKHEIIEQKVYKEIHNHDFYHCTQPVYDFEVLPAHHFVFNSDGSDLLEVPAGRFPESTGESQRWFIGENKSNMPKTELPLRLTSPKIIDDKTYIAPEGFERRETTILHPPELEDMSHYGGPILPIHFEHRQDPERAMQADYSESIKAPSCKPSINRRHVNAKLRKEQG